MWKSLAAIITAALVAGALTGFPRLVEPVSATSAVGIKQIPAPTCPQLGWPYQHCGTGKVRVVTTDRLN